MSEYKDLCRKRANLKGQFTRIRRFFENAEEVSVQEAQVRQAMIEKLYATFDEVQSSIENEKVHEDGSQDPQFVAECEGERTLFEDIYFAVAAKAQQVIDNHNQEMILDRDAAARAAVVHQEGAVEQTQKKINVQLPVLKIPDFDGSCEKWMLFKDAFESIIHNNPGLTDIQKFQYLRSALTGEAVEVIVGMSTTIENYQRAWELLKQNYDNKKLIINTHVSQLLDLPTISRNKPATLRQFIVHMRKNLKALEALQIPPEQLGDMILIHIAKGKLDFMTQRDWEQEFGQGEERFPRTDDLLEFLTQKCNTLEMIEKSKPKSEQPKSTDGKKSERRVSLPATTEDPCRCCRGKHPLYRCEEFAKLSSSDKMKELKNWQLCINCLNRGHQVKDCRGASCKKCSKRHNTLLHRDNERTPHENRQSNDESESSSKVTMHAAPASDRSDTETNPVSSDGVTKYPFQVILSTARIIVEGDNGVRHIARALLDPGSQAHLVTEKLIKRIGIPTSRETQSVSGVNQARTSIDRGARVKIRSINGSFAATIECLVLPSITEKLPQIKIDKSRISIPSGIRLADPAFDEPGQVDVLIGAGLFWSLLCVGQIKRQRGQPSLQRTQLGWIIGGELIAPQEKTSTSVCNLVTNATLQRQLEQFWIQEEIQERQQSKDEEACESYFASTFQREKTGRYIVRLPKRENVVLGDSEEQARRRLISLERRLAKNPDLKQAYEAFLRDYEGQGHMSLATEDSQEEKYYLPHQPVVKLDSVTTKLRVVFDASAKTTRGTSLNDRLMVGPNLQADLLGIILRFRTHEFVLTADIAMMFRQILVDEHDRDMQRILWRTDPQQPIQKFRLNTVTYGTACAPYLAIRCLRQLSVDEEEDLPVAAQSLRRDCYMDDILTGARTLAETIELQKQLAELLDRGQFHLRKWRSNNQDALEHLSERCKTEELLKIDGQEALKTLGLLWNASKDVLQYSVEWRDTYKITKRNVLSKIAQIFDPLGLIGPVLINAKIVMQQLWQLKVEWDESLPQSIHATWETYYSSLPRLNEIVIPRNINPDNASEKIDIFGFADASEKAYGACLYAVSTNRYGERIPRLICSKSKVAPLKTQSIPRLELNAALMLAKIYTIVKEAYGSKIGETYLWSDSSIVLCWMRLEPSTLKTFVANRISKIQNLTENATWLHVPSADNPADVLSRGITVDELINKQLWWHGPTWIVDKNRWPLQNIGKETRAPELKIVTPVAVVVHHEIIERYPSYNKLRRIVAYCLRFRNLTTKKRMTGSVKTEEYKTSETTLVRMVQRQEFPKEFLDLQRGRELSKTSKLVAFRPFLDEEGVIRVGGRLRHAEIVTDNKHPAILPPKHTLTKLIIREEHERLHHCGTEQLLSTLRRRFWILSGRREVKRVLKQCMQCFRCKPTSPEIVMGDLPKARVVGFRRPFSSTGVDYAGPIRIRESRRRGRVRETKAYISVFVCMSTKAVHLELVTELTTEAFMGALRRFTARRGICSELYSDNGTNFIGTNRELKEMYDFLLKEDENIASHLAKKQIKWSFIPPRSPNFGGLWEAAVKAVKKHLYAVTKGWTQTFEEFYTLLVEIEAILNSRPLTPLSNDPSDLSVLTPAHFLIGDSLIQPVQHNLCEVSDNRLSHWQHVQKLRQHFWKRWHLEYLQELQRRHKWFTGKGDLKIDDLVLLMEDNVPPLQWKMGRITELHPGSDSVTRVASVRTANGVFKRSVRKLCCLPIEGQLRDSQSEK